MIINIKTSFYDKPIAMLEAYKKIVAVAVVTIKRMLQSYWLNQLPSSDICLRIFL